MYGRWVINGRSNGQPTFAIWAPKGKAKPGGSTIEVGRRYEGRFHRHRQRGAPMARNLLAEPSQGEPTDNRLQSHVRQSGDSGGYRRAIGVVSRFPPTA